MNESIHSSPYTAPFTGVTFYSLRAERTSIHNDGSFIQVCCLIHCQLCVLESKGFGFPKIEDFRVAAGHLRFFALEALFLDFFQGIRVVFKF